MITAVHRFPGLFDPGINLGILHSDLLSFLYLRPAVGITVMADYWVDTLVFFYLRRLGFSLLRIHQPKGTFRIFTWQPCQRTSMQLASHLTTTPRLLAIVRDFELNKLRPIYIHCSRILNRNNLTILFQYM